MNRIMLSIVLALVLISGLVFFASANPLDAQQNGTSNMTSMQQGQQNQTTGIGTASEIENITGGNIPVLGNETDIQSQGQNNTSVIEGMQQEQVTTDTNMTSNQSGAGGNGGGGMTNQTVAPANQTGGNGQQQQQQQGNQTEQGPLGQIGEAISNMFGGQSLSIRLKLSVTVEGVVKLVKFVNDTLNTFYLWNSIP